MINFSFLYFFNPDTQWGGILGTVQFVAKRQGLFF